MWRLWQPSVKQQFLKKKDPKSLTVLQNKKNYTEFCKMV
jgi:hypothetical protein